MDELDTDEETDEQTPDQIKKRTDAPVRTRSKNVRKKFFFVTELNNTIKRNP